MDYGPLRLKTVRSRDWFRSTKQAAHPESEPRPVVLCAVRGGVRLGHINAAIPPLQCLCVPRRQLEDRGIEGRFGDFQKFYLADGFLSRLSSERSFFDWISFGCLTEPLELKPIHAGAGGKESKAS